MVPRRTGTPGLNALTAVSRTAPTAAVLPTTQRGRLLAAAAPHHPGGRYLIEETIRAQFGPVLRAFGGLRRRRNELEYPLYPTERANADEASETLNTAAEIIEASAKLLPDLGFF